MPSDFTIQPHHSCMAQLMWPLATIEEYNTCQAVAIYALYAIAFVVTALTIVGLPLDAWAFYVWGELVSEKTAHAQAGELAKSTTGEKDSLEGRLTDAQTTNTTLVGRALKAEGDLAQRTQEKGSLEQQLKQAQDDNVELDQRLTKTEQVLSEMTTEKVALKTQLEDAQRELGVPQEDYQKLQNALLRISGFVKAKTSEPADIEAAVQTMRLNATKHNTLARDAMSSNTYLTKENERLREENEGLVGQLRDAQKKNAGLADGLKEVQTKQQSLEQHQLLVHDQMKELQRLREVNAKQSQQLLELTEATRKEKEEHKAGEFAVPAPRPVAAKPKAESRRPSAIDAAAAKAASAAPGGIHIAMQRTPTRPTKPATLQLKPAMRHSRSGSFSSMSPLSKARQSQS